MELDPATVQRAQGGDRSAQEAFLRRYAGPLHALIRRAGVPGDVEDLLNELLQRLIVALPKWRPGGPATLTTWVFTIAQRFVIDASRKRHLHLAPIEQGHAFVICDTDARTVEYLRVEYDIEASAQKIFDADLALNFGKRLFLGV